MYSSKITNPREKWESHQYSSTQAHKCRKEAGTASRGAVHQRSRARSPERLREKGQRSREELQQARSYLARRTAANMQERERERETCRCMSDDQREERRVFPRGQAQKSKNIPERNGAAQARPHMRVHQAIVKLERCCSPAKARSLHRAPPVRCQKPLVQRCTHS